MFHRSMVGAVLAAAAYAFAPAAHAADSTSLPTVPLRAAKAPPAPAPADRAWLSLNAKGVAGRDSGLGAAIGLSYLGGGGGFVRLQHSGVLVEERSPREEQDSDCVFFACFFEAFGAMFDFDVASVVQTELLVGRRLAPDSRWFAAVGVARQAYEEAGDQYDRVGAAFPVVAGWSTASRRSGAGFEVLITGVAGKVSSSVGVQFGLTLGGRVD